MKKQTKVKNWKQQQLISSIVEKTEPQCSCSRSYCCCQNVLAFQQYISIFLTRWFIQWGFFGVFHFVLFLFFFLMKANTFITYTWLLKLQYSFSQASCNNLLAITLICMVSVITYFWYSTKEISVVPRHRDTNLFYSVQSPKQPFK